jgi:hypothetical protein
MIGHELSIPASVISPLSLLLLTCIMDFSGLFPLEFIQEKYLGKDARGRLVFSEEVLRLRAAITGKSKV